MAPPRHYPQAAPRRHARGLARDRRYRVPLVTSQRDRRPVSYRPPRRPELALDLYLDALRAADLDPVAPQDDARPFGIGVIDGDASRPANMSGVPSGSGFTNIAC
jgi:hypothetical protein